MPAQPKVELLFVGDIYGGHTVAHVSKGIRDIAAKADLVSVNLESPLTDHDTPFGDKSIYLKNSPATLTVLRELSTDIACLANNHVCDWGGKGLADTRRLLAENSIAAVGAGRDLGEAEAPVIVERKGLRVATLAFGNEAIQTVPAGEDEFGCAPLNEARMLNAVADLRGRADVIVLQVHWGYADYHYPLPEHVALGRSLIDGGATLVVGHHPHVIQGYERYGNGAILYSLGDFIFASYYRKGKPHVFSRENRRALMCVAQVEPRRVSGLDCYHTVRRGELTIAELLPQRHVPSRERFLRRLSRPFGRKSYARFFRWYILRRTLYRALRWSNPRQWRRFDLDVVRALWLSMRRVVSPS